MRLFGIHCFRPTIQGITNCLFVFEKCRVFRSPTLVAISSVDGDAREMPMRALISVPGTSVRSVNQVWGRGLIGGWQKGLVIPVVSIDQYISIFYQ